LSPLPCTCYPHATRMRTTCVLPAYRSTPQEYEGYSLARPSHPPTLKQLEQKKQKKTPIDSNEQFADIEKIKRAQEAVARQAAA
jgi:hypothetical protein